MLVFFVVSWGVSGKGTCAAVLNHPRKQVDWQFRIVVTCQNLLKDNKLHK